MHYKKWCICESIYVHTKWTCIPSWCIKRPTSFLVFKLNSLIVSSVLPDANTPRLEIVRDFTFPVWEWSVKLSLRVYSCIRKILIIIIWQFKEYLQWTQTQTHSFPDWDSIVWTALKSVHAKNQTHKIIHRFENSELS